MMMIRMIHLRNSERRFRGGAFKTGRCFVEEHSNQRCLPRHNDLWCRAVHIECQREGWHWPLVPRAARDGAAGPDSLDAGEDREGAAREGVEADRVNYRHRVTTRGQRGERDET